MELLGIDNVFFQVGNLEEAIAFYEKLGFQLKFKIPRISAALLKIGKEEPGLMLTESKEAIPSRLWVEVASAEKAMAELGNGKMLVTATGKTLEVTDPWGNTIGFADYINKSELSRNKDEKHHRSS